MSSANSISTVSRWLAMLVAALAGPAFAGCATETPTRAVVSNDLSAGDAGGSSGIAPIVYRAWWTTTLFPSPILPGERSEVERTIPASDFAYALLAPDWSPESGAPPARLIAAKSTEVLSVGRGDQLTISVSALSFAGDCATGHPLSADDARFITERIFPAEFAGSSYDPATCIATQAGAGAGAGATPDAGGSDGAGDRGGS